MPYLCTVVSVPRGRVVWSGGLAYQTKDEAEATFARKTKLLDRNLVVVLGDDGRAYNLHTMLTTGMARWIARREIAARTTAQDRSEFPGHAGQFLSTSENRRSPR